MDDIILHILYYVNYHDVYQFCFTSKHYYSLLSNVIAYKQRASLFPRVHKCKYHIIPKDVIHLEIIEYNMDSMMKQLEKCIVSINALHLDLVYGDIVELETSALDQPHQLIYNGSKLEHLYYDENIITFLPKHYTIIDNLVPADYWYHDNISYMPINMSFLPNFYENKFDDNGYWKSFFIYNNYTYNVYFVYPEWDNNGDDLIFSKITTEVEIVPEIAIRILQYNYNTIIIWN